MARASGGGVELPGWSQHTSPGPKCTAHERLGEARSEGVDSNSTKSFGLTSPFAPPQPLRGHAQGAVELARRVLPSDDRSQLYQGVVAEVFAHAFKKVISDVPVRERDGIRVLQRCPLLLVVERARRVLSQGEDLLVGISTSLPTAAFKSCQKTQPLSEATLRLIRATRAGSRRPEA